MMINKPWLFEKCTLGWGKCQSPCDAMAYCDFVSLVNWVMIQEINRRSLAPVEKSTIASSQAFFFVSSTLRGIQWRCANTRSLLIPRDVHSWDRRDVPSYAPAADTIDEGKLLPPNITHLQIDGNHGPTAGWLFLGSSSVMTINHLPVSLTHLVLGDAFNLPIDHLPNSLTHLTLGKHFNQTLNDLPRHLKTLILWSRFFNHSLDHLPDSLGRLDMTQCEAFNQPIDHLPCHLTHLLLGRQFNQAIDHLPAGLTHLRNPSLTFNQPLDHLPSALMNLTLDSETAFRHPLDCLPEGLGRLSFLPTLCVMSLVIYPFEFFQRLPRRLTHLTLPVEFSGSLDHFPDTLTHLIFPKHSFFNGNVDRLPPQLCELRLGRSFNQPVDHLPRQLSVLSLGWRFNQPLNHLPPCLRVLSIKSDVFNQSLRHLPPSLTALNSRSGRLEVNHWNGLLLTSLQRLSICIPYNTGHYFRHPETSPPPFDESSVDEIRLPIHLMHLKVRFVVHAEVDEVPNYRIHPTNHHLMYLTI